ncbi:hypothetical protein EVAR_78965_1 [Eumeta japonica]|uniref:Peptidase M12B propeptide domain-containing protein n=1 Tax=Eumeta variegata TaxID=151549 RepID=A0A4C1US30_EUMVA|nr:hypothetical protein EVAR_78965_1 [Eumeta japonica]
MPGQYPTPERINIRRGIGQEGDMNRKGEGEDEDVRRKARNIEIKSWDSWWEEGVSSVDELSADVDVEVVYLPALLAREPQLAADRLRDGDVPLHYAFEAFGRSFELKLVPNRKLVANQFGVWSGRGEEPALASPDVFCHYLHAGPDVVAAFSACRDHALIISVGYYDIYEVRGFRLLHGKCDAWANDQDGAVGYLSRSEYSFGEPRFSEEDGILDKGSVARQNYNRLRDSPWKIPRDVF